MTNLQHHSIGKFFLLVFVCFLINCAAEKPIEQTVIVVKVPPVYNSKLSDEENYYRFQHFLFPQQEIPNPIPKGLPNDHSIFLVSIDETGNLKLNNEDEGNLSDTNLLTTRLSKIFREREEGGVYEPGSWRVAKAVGVKAAHPVKYGDLIKVIDAVEQSGADPIVLRFDDDAGNFKNYFKN